jgi:hypothetical protein
VRARARKWSLVGAFFTRLIFEELEEEFVFKKDRCSHTKNESIDCFETPETRGVFQVFRQVRDVHSLSF